MAACQASTHIHTDQPQVRIKALDWISDKTDPAEHLTVQLAACLTQPSKNAVQRGELLFNSPLLLGGQAAKAGLSCASCHRNGRGNPDFVFKGISGEPGTADVTNGLFSIMRADRVFNPVPIPDLTLPEGQIQVDRTLPGELETFLKAQIVEEFSGVGPDADVVTDLAAYIRALDVRSCAGPEYEPQTWQAEFNRLQVGLRAIDTAMASEGAYANAVRAALGRLYNRYTNAKHRMLRDELESLSRQISSGRFDDIPKARLSALQRELKAYADSSFYNREVLLDALSQ